MRPMDQKPWPKPYSDRILDEFGAGFATGGMGSLVHSYARDSLKGQGFGGGIQIMRLNAARIGGRCALWAGIYGMVDTPMAHLRRKEDPWNSILAASAATAALNIRKGLTYRYAAIGSILMASFELSAIMFERIQLPEIPAEWEDDGVT